MGAAKTLMGAGIGGLLGSHIGIAVAGTAFSGMLPIAIVGAAVAGMFGRSSASPEQQEAILTTLLKYGRRPKRDGKAKELVQTKRLLHTPTTRPPASISDAVIKRVVPIPNLAPIMRTQKPIFSSWRISFEGRYVDVGLHPKHGLFVVDPAGQLELPIERVRLYRAKTNALVEVAIADLVELQRPKSERQARIAVWGYAAFLNPSLKRPAALDADIKESVTQDRNEENEPSRLDVKMREDMRDLAQEMTKSTGERYRIHYPSPEQPYWSVETDSNSNYYYDDE